MDPPSNTPQSQASRDAQLVRRICDGDGSALSTLLRAYFAWLVDVATSIVTSSDLAQDVVQDVFLRLWDIRSSLEIRGSVAAYLYKAVRNKALDVLAHERAQHDLQQRVHASYAGIEPAVSNEGESNLLHSELEAALGAALQTLQPRMREIFLMRVDAGMSYAEIATVLGIGVPTVHVQMSRATKSLVRQMAKWVDPDHEWELLRKR